MARDWPQLPVFQSEEDAAEAAPEGWTVRQIEDVFEKLDIGKRFDQKSCSGSGRVPVVDQSADGFVGFHDEDPGVSASKEMPVITFANHTCEMRVMRRPFSVIQNVFPMVGKGGVSETLFFYYATKGRVHSEEYKGHYPDFRRLWIPLPPLAEQKAIASVLGALDDKIELNRRMNATLEAMARALFQSWFVDFDPVRAKLDGRPPAALDPATAALFPEHLEDSPLGHIPRGWEVRTIESVCKTVTRGVTPEYGEGTGRFIINQRVNRGSDLDWSSLKELSQRLEVPPERFAKRWDVLVNCLGEGTLGRTHLYKGESDIYAIDQHMSICRAEHPSGGAYIYQVLAGADGQAKIESLKTGSTGMTMFNISKLRTFELVWPSAEILAAYFKTVEPLWLRIANNDQESRTLATLRDTLLPKLMSGELSVAGIESKLEAVT